MHIVTKRNFVGDWLSQRQAFAAFACAVLLLLALQYRHHIPRFYFDAEHYWDQANPVAFMADNGTIRGYVFPFLLYLVRQVTDLTANPIAAYRVVASVIYAAILTCLVPKWFVAMFGGSLSFGRRLVPVALIAIIFPGTILHPLSDLPALLLAWGGLYCIYRAKAARGVSRWALFAWLVGAGILSGAASNTRTIYMFMIPASMLLAALLFPRARMACVGAAVAGLALASLPQAAFNLKVNKEFNPMVIVPMGQNSLFVVHLLVGVTTQRYETSYLFGGFAYRDPAGEQLAKKLRVHQPLPAHADLLAGIAPTVHISDYLQMVGKYPLEFLGIYARHAVNGLDVRDGRSYVKTFSARRNAISVFNFLVLALAAWTLLAHRSEQARAGPTQGAAPFWWVGLLALLLPVAAILPGVVETRFFLPLHLLAYCVIAFHCRPQGWWTQAKSHPLWLLVTTVIACLYFSIVLSAMAQG